MTDEEKRRVGRPKLFNGERTRFSVTLPKHMAEWIEEEAKRRKTSAGTIIREAVGEFMAKINVYYRKVNEDEQKMG